MRALELYINQALSHPLVYGENLRNLPLVERVPEPSPRVRGKRKPTKETPLTVRAIPSCTGKTCSY